MQFESRMNRPYFLTREDCPICSSKKNKKIYEQPYSKDPIKGYLESFYSPQGGVEFCYLENVNYSLIECQNCLLIYQKYIPNDEIMELLYERWIDPKLAFKRHLENDDLEYFSNIAQEVMQIIAYFGKIPSELDFFDFGMGWGKWALMAKSFGCNSYGSELSKRRIDYSRSNGINIVLWEDIAQHQFDFINTEQVFEHLPDPLNTLIHLKKSLKVDGLIKISVPTTNDINRRLKIMDWKSGKGERNSLNAVAPLEHINFFRRRSLIDLATRAGLSEVYIPVRIQYQYTSKWSGSNRIAMNLLLPIIRNILKKQNYIFLRNSHSML